MGATVLKGRARSAKALNLAARGYGWALRSDGRDLVSKNRGDWAIAEAMAMQILIRAAVPVGAVSVLALLVLQTVTGGGWIVAVASGTAVAVMTFPFAVIGFIYTFAAARPFRRHRPPTLIPRGDPFAHAPFVTATHVAGLVGLLIGFIAFVMG